MENTNWKPTEKRFIAFFDILGFKDLIQRNSHEDIYNKLTSISKIKVDTEKILNGEINNSIIEKQERIKTASFSDSIILFTKNDSIPSFEYFLVAVNTFFTKVILSGIPIKGAMAHGELSINQSQQIYFGQPLIDAYQLEEDVNYFGVVAHNSIDKYILELKGKNRLSEVVEELTIEFQTPMKYGDIFHRNINWINYYKEYSNEINIRSVIEKFRITSSGSPRKYIDNTLKIKDLFEKV